MIGLCSCSGGLGLLLGLFAGFDYLLVVGLGDCFSF